MSLKPIRYPLDLTGVSTDNAVVNEIHTLKPTKIRVFVPTYGGFFTKSFVLRDVATNVVLQRGIQYEFDNLFEMASIDAKQEVAGVVVITDQTVSSNISCDYQAIGGLYGYSNEAIIAQIETLKLDERPIEWGNIFNKPATYPPAPHLHDVGDVYGFEYIVHALQQLRQAILTGDDGSHTIIYQYIDNERDKLIAEINKTNDELEQHVKDTSNPHKTTAAQVGAYTTAQVDALIKTIRDSLNAHIADKNNPHNTTAAQVGAYTKAQVDAFFAELRDGILAAVEAHIADKTNPHGVTAAQVGAYTKAQVDTLINGVKDSLNAHIANKNNPHAVTAAQVGAYTKAQTDTLVSTVNTALNNHASNKNNPHAVTAAQVGAYTKAETDTRITNITNNAYLDPNNGNKIKQSLIPISTTAGNKITWNGNGIYYKEPDNSNEPKITYENGKIMVTIKVNGVNQTKQIFPAVWADTI